MFNLIFALVTGLTVGTSLRLSGWLSFGEASVPAILAAIISYILFAKSTFRKFERVMGEAAQMLQSMPPKVEQAITVMQKAYALARFQFGIRSQVDTQIGVAYFLKQEFSRAQPYLSRSLLYGHWMGGAMLGVIQYKKRDYDGMRKTFGVITRRAKKQSLVWSLYAYLLVQMGDRAQAQAVLGEGVTRCPDDPRIRDALTSLENGKRIKMKAYKEQWYQFHLERPPAIYQQAAQGGGRQRISRSARRGRW